MDPSLSVVNAHELADHAEVPGRQQYPVHARWRECEGGTPGCGIPPKTAAPGRNDQCSHCPGGPPGEPTRAASPPG